MSNLQKLKAITTRKELAVLLGYKPSALTAIIYKTPDALKYSTFEISKKSGGTRTIKAPTAKLKKLQSHLSHLLYQSLHEIEEVQKSRPLSYGFRRDRSIIQHARQHKRKRWVLNIDLQEFFPSFNFGRVRGYFLKDKHFSLSPEVATTMAQIACDGGALPQGSPCSPVISELVGQILDMRLVVLAKKYNVTYSRYADDITFSTNQKEFPLGMAYQDAADASKWNLSNELINKINNSGFLINETKTRMQFRGSRQMVTGLLVNEKINIPSDYYRNARAMCDSLFKSGQYFTSKTAPQINPAGPSNNFTSSLNILHGILGHIYQVTQSEERRDIQDQRNKPRAIRTLYRRFLFYRRFVALDAPLLVTEGKTDITYLREAVKKCKHPFVSIGKNGESRNVRYFKYGTTTSEILKLGTGGTDHLNSLLMDYKDNLYPSKFKPLPKAIAHRPMNFPVIIVLDNDNGLPAISSFSNKNFGVNFTCNSTDDFYHIKDNLYVVKTPELGKPQSSIEDLFPQKWLDYELNGKKFNPKNKKINIDTEYGKEIFAQYVVKPNMAEIEFDGFLPLLERIQKVLTHYSNNHP